MICLTLLQVPVFQLLTGWPQEDMLDGLAGTSLTGGELFDRLEQAVGGPLRPPPELPSIAAVSLLRHARLRRPPPRLVVLTGPGCIGRGQLLSRLLCEYPDKLGATVSTTSRPPREHEVEGRCATTTWLLCFLLAWTYTVRCVGSVSYIPLPPPPKREMVGLYIGR